MIRFCLLVLCFWCVIHNTQAVASDKNFGLAMTGTPLYTVQDTHLSYANPEAPKGGTLKQAGSGRFDSLNPYNIKGTAAEGLAMVTDKLMARVWDEPFTLYPLIAQSVEVPDDRASITFHLNPKARFHDSTSITTDDVLFTFQTLKEFGRPNMRRVYKLATPHIINTRSIRFDLSAERDRETVMILAMMPILSKAYWKDKKFDTTTLEAPVGNGPYKIKHVDVGKRIVYERVKDYWAKDLLVNKGHYNFDIIQYDYFRDDTVAFESFKKGDLDIRREWDAGTWQKAYSFDKNSKSSAIIKAELPHGRPDKTRGFIFNTRRPPFDDIRVRQALNLFFDFDWINRNLFYGQYNQITSFYQNTDLARPLTNDTGPSLSQREKWKQANDLLTQAGWIVRKGKRVHKDTGNPMQFEIILNNPADEKIALSFKHSLEKMGISPHIRVLDSAAFNGRLNEYDFDMILHYWFSTLSPGTEQYLYWSCEAKDQKARWNYAGICDPAIDSLAKAIPTASTREDLATKTSLLDQKLWNGNYFIPLYHNPKDYIAYWPSIAHPEITPLYGIVAETWWSRQNLHKTEP